MIRAIFFGVFFVFLCVAIPSFLGFYYSSNQVQEDARNTQLEDQVNDQTEIERPQQKFEVEEQKETAEDLEDQTENEIGSRDDLVFSDRDEAIEAVMERFSLTDLLSIFRSVRNGMNEEERGELFAKLQEEFTDEEIEALKVIGFAELEKVLQ
ncbi:hypothetical protein N0O92_00390 [Alkalihalobacillus sp. MEB130]|uniref:hypothetical protein n=1 Tax=Alkalihalobacillus sp. MEB130 TaxID=2976704 RepID=UPI0028E0385C|nr:hypothetical protein [Alkalihalobacillus sp. MEB130]MDT8858666.1 hypothetical protein [Alkalihalobacillus sp. MEB130]